MFAPDPMKDVDENKGVDWVFVAVQCCDVIVWQLPDGNLWMNRTIKSRHLEPMRWSRQRPHSLVKFVSGLEATCFIVALADLLGFGLRLLPAVIERRVGFEFIDRGTRLPPMIRPGDAISWCESSNQFTLLQREDKYLGTTPQASLRALWALTGQKAHQMVTTIADAFGLRAEVEMTMEHDLSRWEFHQVE